jgi:pilus assembly protein TadC
MTAPGLPARQVRRSSRSSSNGAIEIVLATAVAAFFIAITDLVLAWPVMIALGVWHSYIHQVPALGWFASLVTLVAIGIIILPSQMKVTDS